MNKSDDPNEAVEVLIEFANGDIVFIFEVLLNLIFLLKEVNVITAIEKIFLVLIDIPNDKHYPSDMIRSYIPDITAFIWFV